MADDQKQLVKMLVEVYKDQAFKEPGTIRVGTRDVGEWRVLFNPEEYTLTRSNRYNTTQAAGTSKPSTAKGHGHADQLRLTLFFDGTGVTRLTTM